MNYIYKWKIKINKSPIILLFRILFSNFLLDMLVIIILVVDYMNMVSKWHSIFSIEEYFFLWTLLINMIVIVTIFIRWIYSYYIFNWNKLIYYNWIYFRDKKEFILGHIWAIDFKQTILWKIFNYWDIFIYIQNQKFKLKWLSDPEEFIKLIWKFKYEHNNQN